MIAKDILRIALFVLFVAFALRSGSGIRLRGSVRLNSPGETEDTEAQQLLQRLKDSRDMIKQEPTEYGNIDARKDAGNINSGGFFSAGAVITITFLLLILM